MRLKKEEAGYLSFQGRPFQCAACKFFYDGQCRLVTGPISPDACCNLYEAAGHPIPLRIWLSGRDAVKKVADENPVLVKMSGHAYMLRRHRVRNPQ